MASSLGIDGLEELTEVGRGGFGIVYRAHQPALGRVVAVKVVVGVLDDRVRERFEREGRAMGALSGHPNIVTVYTTGLTKDNQPYLVMEYLEAGSLADRLERDGPLPWSEVLEIGTKLAGALEAAHCAGVLHRDIKPGNVLISSYGEPKLADFGIACLEGGPETRSGIITASLAHAPPEVLDGRGATKQSDVYSLCSTLYELVTGTAPFVRESDETVIPLLTRIANEPVADLRPRGIPHGVCTVLEAGMTKDPNERIPTADQLEERLRAVGTSPDVRTRDFHRQPPGSPPDATDAGTSTSSLASPEPEQFTISEKRSGATHPDGLRQGSEPEPVGSSAAASASSEPRWRTRPRLAIAGGATALVAIVTVVALLVTSSGGGGSMGVFSSPLRYTFQSLNLANGVTLTRVWTIHPTGNGQLGGQITIHNQNATPWTGDATEVIPKSLANSVDNVQFTPQPDVVLQRDPAVLYHVGNLPANGSQAFRYTIALARGTANNRHLRQWVKDENNTPIPTTTTTTTTTTTAPPQRRRR